MFRSTFVIISFIVSSMQIANSKYLPKEKAAVQNSLCFSILRCRQWRCPIMKADRLCRQMPADTLLHEGKRMPTPTSLRCCRVPGRAPGRRCGARRICIHSVSRLYRCRSAACGKKTSAKRAPTASVLETVELPGHRCDLLTNRAT